MRRFIFLSFLLLFLVSTPASQPSSAFAHGEGKSYEETVGNFLVDIGYNPPQPEAGSPVSFDFNLIDKTSGQPAPFTDIWVQVIKDGETILATGIHKQEIGATTLLYAFPQAGDYEVAVRYQDADKEIVQASFPLTIAALSTEAPKTQEQTARNIPAVWGIGGFIAGAFIPGAILTAKRGRKKKNA